MLLAIVPVNLLMKLLEVVEELGWLFDAVFKLTHLNFEFLHFALDLDGKLEAVVVEIVANV